MFLPALLLQHSSSNPFQLGCHPCFSVFTLLQPSCFPHNNAKLPSTHFLALFSSSNPTANIHIPTLHPFPPELTECNTHLPGLLPPSPPEKQPDENIGFRLLTATELLLFWFSIRHCLPLILPSSWSPLQNRTPPFTFLLFPAPLLLHSQSPEAPLTSWESSRCSFCKVLSGFALQSVHTCLTFFHLSPYILVNFSSQSTTFFPQFRVFFSSSATSSPFPLSKASLFSSLVSFLSLKWTVLYFTFFYLLFSKTSRVHAHHRKLSFP